MSVDELNNRFQEKFAKVSTLAQKPGKNDDNPSKDSVPMSAEELAAQMADKPPVLDIESAEAELKRQLGEL
jgi:hypothetical protein